MRCGIPFVTAKWNRLCNLRHTHERNNKRLEVQNQTKNSSIRLEIILVITIVDRSKCELAALWLSYKLEYTLFPRVSGTGHVKLHY